MKRNAFLLFVAAVASWSISYTAQGQELVQNGDFTNNTAGGTSFNMTNQAFTSTVAFCTGFGDRQEIDLLIGSSFFGPLPLVGDTRVGLNGPGNGQVDAFSTTLLNPVVAGSSYRLRLDVVSKTYTETNLQIGISSSPTNFGTLLQSVSAIRDIWQSADVILNAPAGGGYLTFRPDPAVSGFAFVTNISLMAVVGSTFSVEGTVTGLTTLGLVLQNNAGDDLDVFTNGNFLFDTRLDDGSAYAVTVLTNPTGQTCSVTNGSGTISGAGVTDVTVACEDDLVATYSVGGTVTGSGNDFTLLNNGGDALTITSDGSFTFDTALPEGDSYAVSVDASSLDPSDSCSVTNGNGTIGTADVTNVAVTCERVFQLGGIISGVTSGGSITLQNNGGDDVTWNDDPITSYRFPTRLAQGATYNVTVLTPPTGQTCTVANATGTMSNSNFVDVNLTCADDVVPPAPIVPIPTLSQWALILLSTLLGLMVFVNRRRLF